MKAVPVTDHETFAEGEFNRFYARGLCLRAIRDNQRVEVYRARESLNARSASVALIGQQFDPAALLTDLRTSVGMDTALQLPPGPNSGLSIKLV